MKVYRTAPQAELKAALEIRRSGRKAYVPREDRSHTSSKGKRYTRKHPIMPRYVCAESKPRDAAYVRECIGDVTREDLSKLYKHRRTDIPKPRTVQIGDHVTLPAIGVHKVEMSGAVVSRRGNRLRVRIGDGHTIQVHADMVTVSKRGNSENRQ